MIVQMRLRSDTRKHQDLRRAEDPGRQDNLALGLDSLHPAALGEFDALGATFLDHHPQNFDAGFHFKIVPVALRVQIGARRTAADAVFH